MPERRRHTVAVGTTATQIHSSTSRSKRYKTTKTSFCNRWCCTAAAMVLATTMLGSAAALLSSRAALASGSASRTTGSTGTSNGVRLFSRGIGSSSAGFVRSPMFQLTGAGRKRGSTTAIGSRDGRRTLGGFYGHTNAQQGSRRLVLAASTRPDVIGSRRNGNDAAVGSGCSGRVRSRTVAGAGLSMSSISWPEGDGGSGHEEGVAVVEPGDQGQAWENADDLLAGGDAEGGDGVSMIGEEAGSADGSMVGDLFEKEDESEWMPGEDVDPVAEKLFFGEKASFADLGLGDTLCQHLETLGLPHSTAIQAAAIPGILSGEDVVIGAETGSGKTLAYLLPIVERLLRGLAVSEELPDELLGNARGWPMFPDVLVLVPNKELCEQVLGVLKGILRALEAAGNTDVTAGTMYGSSYEYPYSPNKPAPSILICTPSFLRKYCNMRVIPLFCKATTLVMDEADMLMEGSYKKELDDILVSFRRADRTVLETCADGNVRNIKKTQYVLAAATLPTYGLKSVDQYIKRVFPDAKKIQQDLMHRHHPAIKQEFIEIGGQLYEKINAVIDVLRESGAEMTRTMVFTNTAASCRRACAALAEEGFSVVPYHKEIVPLERMENLQALRSGRAKVLVCTDLAARGIDVPSVTHIIQLEMATNVVHHLHRLGRAARAGRRGQATTFYDHTTKDLVDSIREAGEGSRLDGSFSRQRGFRKKFKKYGPSRTFQGELRKDSQRNARMSSEQGR